MFIYCCCQKLKIMRERQKEKTENVQLVKVEDISITYMVIVYQLLI